MITKPRKSKRGFGLIEVVISTLIVSLMLVGSLTALASFVQSHKQDSLESQALMYGNSVATMLSTQSYENISENPSDAILLQIKVLDEAYEGSADNNNWSVNYRVEYLTDDLSAESEIDNGIKHILVEVFYQERLFQSIGTIVTDNLD